MFSDLSFWASDVDFCLNHVCRALLLHIKTSCFCSHFALSAVSLCMLSVQSNVINAASLWTIWELVESRGVQNLIWHLNCRLNLFGFLLLPFRLLFCNVVFFFNNCFMFLFRHCSIPDDIAALFKSESDQVQSYPSNWTTFKVNRWPWRITSAAVNVGCIRSYEHLTTSLLRNHRHSFLLLHFMLSATVA